MDVLVVDDSPTDLRWMTHVVLSAFPRAKIRESAGAEDAMHCLQTLEFDLVVADHHMGGATGVQLLRLAERVQPAAKRVMMTADPDFALLEHALTEAKVQGYLRKVWSAERIVQELRKIVTE